MTLIKSGLNGVCDVAISAINIETVRICVNNNATRWNRRSFTQILVPSFNNTVYGGSTKEKGDMIMDHATLTDYHCAINAIERLR